MADDDIRIGSEPSAPSVAPDSPPPVAAPAGGETTAPDDAGKTVSGSVREAIALLKEGARPGEVRPRGTDGKFIAKAEAAPIDSAPAEAKTASTDRDPPKEAGAASKPANAPPTSWSADAKAAWASLPPAIQAAVVKREGEVSEGFRQKSEEAKAWKGIDAVLSPHRQKFASMGYQNDGQVINELLRFQSLYETNPRGLIQQLAASAKVDLRQLAAQTPPAGANPAPVAQPAAAATITPALIDQRVQQEINRREAASTLKAFQSDPKHPHARTPSVQLAMSKALGAGATTLDEAYAIAVALNPELRAQAEAEAARPAASAAKAAAARSAAVSIKGGAPYGANGAAGLPAAMSVRDAVKAAFAQHGGRA